MLRASYISRSRKIGAGRDVTREGAGEIALPHPFAATSCDNSTPRESNWQWRVVWRTAMACIVTLMSFRGGGEERARNLALHKDEELRSVTRREREIYFHKKVNRERHGCLNLRVPTCLGSFTGFRRNARAREDISAWRMTAHPRLLHTYIAS